MAQDVRFIIVNADDALRSELRSVLLNVTGVKVVAEVDEPALLERAVKQFQVNAVLINLDPSPEAVLPVVAEVVAASADIAFIATSASTDGKLILEAIRLGIKEFLPKPIDAKTFAETIDRINSSRTVTAPVGKLISIMGAAGGVGASMFATNLAAELAGLASGRVTIVDLDFRYGQVATLLDVSPTYTLADLCQSPEQLEAQVIERALVKHGSGLQVLSRPSSLAQAETITAASCVGLLSNLLQFNDYVVVDGPTRFDPNAMPVLDLSDSNFLLVQQLVPTVRNAQRLLDDLRGSGYSPERTQLICNRVGGDAYALSVDDVVSTLNLSAFATIPDDWQTVSAAINLGETLQQHGPKTKVREAIQEIAQRLHSPVSESDDKDKRKKGLIGRIFATS
ncbi:MAG: hypothetical protein IH897_01200 [Planctomycetes bacterium]|nr:hypothetical protein [Planctomycetota bacterium]